VPECKIGCGREANGSQGFCRSHYWLWQKYGTPTPEFNCEICSQTYTFAGNGESHKKFCPSCLGVWRQHPTKGPLAKRHNITIFDYLKLLEAQNFSCAICEFIGDLDIDHDNKCCPRLLGNGKRRNIFCGKCIRGLLCYHCNKMLGFYESSNRRLNIPQFEKYLEQPYVRFN
jgi:hypothetical protein